MLTVLTPLTLIKKKKDENDHEKANRQRGALLYDKEECNMWHEYPQKSFLMDLLFFDSLG